MVKLMVPIWVALLLLGGCLSLGIILWMLHKLCIWLEDNDFIYYRRKPDFKGGIGNLFIDIDRLTRPQSVHVLQAQEPEREVRKEEEGEKL